MEINRSHHDGPTNIDKNNPVYGMFRTARTSHQSMSNVNTCEDVTSTWQTCSVCVSPAWHEYNTHQPTHPPTFRPRTFGKIQSAHPSLYIFIMRNSRRFATIVGPQGPKKTRSLQIVHRTHFLTPTTCSSITRHSNGALPRCPLVVVPYSFFFFYSKVF